VLPPLRLPLQSDAIAANLTTNVDGMLTGKKTGQDLLS
jgi:hypothetical protein